MCISILVYSTTQHTAHSACCSSLSSPLLSLCPLLSPPSSLPLTNKVSRRLVMHAPPSVDEGELAVLHQRAADRAHRFVLLPPPPLEEGLLDVSKLTVRVLCKGEDDAVDDPANPGVLDGVVGAAVVLVDGLQPGGRGWGCGRG